LLVEITGFFSTALVALILRGSKERGRPREPFGIFYDWEAMTDYASACRQEMTQWVIAEKKHIDGHHVFTKSRLVALGVSTAGLMLSVMGAKLVSYTSAERVRESARRPRRKPAPAAQAVSGTGSAEAGYDGSNAHAGRG